MDSELARLVPENDRAIGGKERLMVPYRAGAKICKQPIILPRAEKERLHQEARKRGVTMSDIQRTAVMELREHLEPAPALDVDAIAAQLGVSPTAVHELVNDLAARFKSDLIWLKEYATRELGRDVSMSMAARWALNWYRER